MTSLLHHALHPALLASSLFLLSACGAATDEGTEMHQELAATTATTIIAKPLDKDPSFLVASVPVSAGGQSVSASWSMPAGADVLHQCTFDAKRIALKAKLGKVTKSAIVVESVTIQYLSAVSPGALFVVDGKTADKTFTYDAVKFLRSGAPTRKAGTSQTIPVGKDFNVQSNGEGVYIDFNFFDDDGWISDGDTNCGRTVTVVFDVGG